MEAMEIKAVEMESNPLDLLAPSIKVVENDSPAVRAFLEVKQSLESLAAEHDAWIHNSYRTSNDHLYAILQKCYSLYQAMSTDDSKATALRRAFKEYIELKYPRANSASHTMLKIVRCVFGVDRRRVSAYGIVLRRALEEKKKVEEIPEFIRNSGGIEEIRLSRSSNALSSKTKASIASDAVKSKSLGVFTSPHLAASLDGGNIGKEVVLIGTWQADGSVIVRSFVQSSTVVNLALASYYSSNKAEIREYDKTQEAANDDKSKILAITAAASSAVIYG